MTAVAHPPAPWRLAGPFMLLAAPVRLAAARALVPEPVAVRALAPGWTLGCVLAVDYRDGDPLRYREAASLVMPVHAPRQPARPGGWVHAMVVDDPRSVAGGRRMWGVPKELAEFGWGEDGRRTRITVRTADGPYLSAAWRTPRRLLPVPAALRFFGALGGPLRSGRMVGSARLAPARVDLDIPSGSPLAELGLGRPHLGLAGWVDLRATPPRTAGADVPSLRAVSP